MTSSRNPRSSIAVALWVIAVLLSFVAGTLWSRSPDNAGGLALAQTAPLAGARGVFAFPAQLDGSRHGVFMLDVDQGTLWCYEIEVVDGVRKLRLIAGRSWIYDRYLQDFNGLPPSFRQVQELVSQQRTPTGAASARPEPPAPAATKDPTRPR